MADTSTTIVIEQVDPLVTESVTGKSLLKKVSNYMHGALNGSKRVKTIQVLADGAPTLPSVAHIKLTTCAADTVVEINGVPFTGIAGTAIAANDEFDIDGADAADAVDLTRAINACTNVKIAGVVKAVNQLKEILTPSTAIAGNTFTVTLADGVVHTFTGVAGAAVSGTATFSIDTSNAATCTSIVAQVAAYAPFTNKVYAVDGTTIVTLRSLDGALFTLLGTATTLAESGGTTVTVSSYQKGELANCISIKPGGVRASAIITAATPVTTATVTINGQAITGIVQRATATITPDAAVAGNTVTIGTTVFTAVAGVAVLGTATFSIDTSNAATCTDLAAQINAFVPFAGLLTATASSTVVTMRFVTAGTAYDSYPLASTATRLVKSGTTFTDGLAVANNQWDTSPGTTDTQFATDIARCINASTTAAIRNNVYATSDGTTVTVWSKHAGTIGNAITIATSSGATLAITGSLSRLAGGTELQVGGAGATGTLTLTSWLNTETVAINGVTITAHTNTQANDQVDISGSNDADAANLALAINNSTTAGLQDVFARAATNVFWLRFLHLSVC